MDETDLRLIDECFNGDTERYQKSLEEDRYTTISWKDIQSAATILPELEQMVHQAIQQVLGYLPHPAIRLYYEPALRAICQSWRSGGISEFDYIAQLKQHIIPMRNEEMQAAFHGGFDDSIYLCYHKTSLLYDQTIKTRLTRFLGYEPQLHEAMLASRWSKDFMAKDDVLLTDKITDIDLKAITMIKYRDVLLEKGLEAANASPLSAMLALTNDTLMLM